MFCSHCGAQNPDNSAFCESCGANISADAPIKPRKPIDRRKLLIIGGIVAVAVIALVATMIIANMPKTVKLDDYVSVSFSGYDSVGKAELSWDTEKLMKDLSEELDTTNQAKLAAYLLGGQFDLELDKTSGLSNGDTVSLKLTVDDEALEELGLKIKLDKSSYEVADLKPMTVVDPFDYLQVVYSGYEPYAGAELKNTATDDFLRDNMYFYTYDDYYDLSNGDTATICVSVPENYLEYGYDFKKFELEYTFTGVPQPEEIDVFELLTVKFTGVDGDGQLSYEVAETDDSFLSGLYFSFDRRTGLTTGDTVTCTVSYYSTPEQYGYKVLSNEKTYTVPQLGSYVTDYTTLSENIQQQLTDTAKKAVEEYYNAEYVSGYLYTDSSIFSNTYDLDDYGSFENFRLTHAYTYSATSWGSTYYVTGLVFSMDMLGHPTEAANGTGYCYVSWEDLVLKADGTLEEGWEEELSVNSGAYITFELLQDKRLDYYDDLVVTEQ